MKQVLSSQPQKEYLRILGKGIVIIPKALSLEQVYGSVPSQKKPEDFNLLAHTAKEEHAEKVVQKIKSR